MPTATYKNRVLDARPDSLDLRDREYQPPLRSLPPRWPSERHIHQLLPAYTQAGMILNQGKEGACTGFGLAAVINYLIWRNAIAIEQDDFTAPADIRAQRVSPRMLYNMARLYDEWEGEDYQGSSCRGAMKGWHRHGVCTEKSWPYSASNDIALDGKWPEEATRQPLGVYYRINKNSVIDMQAAILDVGAIYCSCSVHEGWWLKTEKKLPSIKQSPKKIGGHAFAIVGYTVDGFIVQNSWGEKWGFHGFAVLTYADWVKHATDAWVAVRGAPINKTSPVTFSSHSLQSVATEENQPSASTIQKALRYPYRHPEATLG